MRKSREICDPESCFNRAKETEMVFVLLGRDRVAPWVIRLWCIGRCLIGKNKWNDRQIQDALWCAKLMQRERNEGKA
jgi:hypothetical protein